MVGDGRRLPRRATSGFSLRQEENAVVVGSREAVGWFLVVEDEPNTLRGLCRLVHQLAPMVLCVGVQTGMDALPFLDKRCLLGALVDIELPGMSGFDLIDHIRQRLGREVPIAVLTGHHEHANRAYLAGAEFLLKPSHAAAVVEFVRRAGVERWSHIAAKVADGRGSIAQQPLRALLLEGIGVPREGALVELRIDESTLRGHRSIAMSWLRMQGLAPSTIREGISALLGQAA
jgi:CheY-like chemotaxis protein